MFRRSRSGSRRAARVRTDRPALLGRRKPLFELLEDRRLLAVFTVTSNLDTVDAADGVLTLREAIIAANAAPATFDTVNFSPALSGQTIQLTNVDHVGELLISGTMTISGSALATPITVKAFAGGAGAGDGARIFNINDSLATDSPVSLRGLTLTGGDISATADGGAIYSAESLSIDSCTITGNASLRKGGGIYAKGTTYIYASTISSNTAVYGGGVALQGTGLTPEIDFVRTTITKNTATKDGGGVWLKQGNSAFLKSTVSENTATGFGGGVYDDSAAWNVSQTTITGNKSTTAAGGGVFIKNAPAGGKFYASTITNNTAVTKGGGVYVSGNSMDFSGTTITGNKATGSTGSGGGIFAINVTSTISRDAIFNTESNISNNEASFGGGLYLNGGSTIIRSTTIAGNSAKLQSGGILAIGGGVFAKNGNILQFESSTVSGNFAAVNGGGIYTDAGNMALLNSTVSGNSANFFGGGIWDRVVMDRSLNIFYSTITKNTSDADATGVGSGGGIYLKTGGGVVELRNTIIAGNNDFTNTAPDLDNVTAGGNPMLTAKFTLIGNNKNSGLAAGNPIGMGNRIGSPPLPLNPLLGPLQNNGGPTKTHALQPGSLAINNGDPAAVQGVGSVPANDQRGVGFARVADGRLDIGAFEFQQPPTKATFNLLASSDTGMFNFDHVTSKMQPAFGGFGVANSTVFVYAQANDANGDPSGDPFIIGTGKVGPDASDGFVGNDLGVWEVTIEPLADGEYNFWARFDTPSDGTGGFSDAVAGPPMIFAGGASKTIPANGVVASQLTIPAPTAPAAPLPPTPPIIVDLNVTVNITFPDDRDLTLTLVSPSGTSILLANHRGNPNPILSQADFKTTVFDDQSSTAIGSGVPPFNGTFRPEQPLSVLVGESFVGTWTLFVTNSDGDTGSIDDWSLTIVEPITVVIDTVAPNQPFLDLNTFSDTGRNNADNITRDNNPSVSMTSTDPNGQFAKLLFTDNLKFRVYDRFVDSNGNAAPEFLIYDSAQDGTADQFMTVGDMFTAQTLITVRLPVLTPVTPAIRPDATLSDGLHNLKVVVEDRAGNLSHEYILSITVDRTAPPVSFGLPDTGGALTPTSATDGLKAESDTGVTTVPATYADRITSDTTPTIWGRAEANAVVRVYFDKNNDGIIQLDGPLADTFLGQVTAIPTDGNDGYPNGYWEFTSALDLNQIAGLPKDGLRQLLATSEDVAGNPPTSPGIGDARVILNPAILDIFIDTQGPQVTDVTVNNLTSAEYKLFDPKPTSSGPTPPVTSLTIAVRDLPLRVNNTGAVNDFLYDALVKGIASSPGNYVLKGDHVGNIAIKSIDVLNIPLTATLTAVTNASQFTAANLIGETVNVGDFVFFTSGANAGQTRQVATFNKLTGEITLTAALPAVPAVGDGIRVASTLALAQSLAQTASIKLTFFAPLPDDRYTLTVKDNLVDPANNKLDGESHASEPQEMPTFPSGDGVPGGNFVARFSVDSHPEIGNYVSQNINVDINGNFVWDPANVQVGGDAHNVDISFTLPVKDPATGNIAPGGFNVHDLLTVGKFRPKSINTPPQQAQLAVGNFFDQLAAYGNSAELGGQFRWLVDTNSDGVINTADGDIIQIQGTLAGFNSTARAGAIPVAGDFDRNRADGDEIGLYYAGIWAVDTNHDYVIDRVINSQLFGTPIVGDFDGNGFDDLAVFNSNTFYFDLSVNFLTDSTSTGDASFVWGFPGVLDRPVAADMDGDGIDDVGLWVPRTDASLPQGVAQWYFLLSNDFASPGVPAAHTIGNVNKINHPFTPVPFGFDIFAEFGDERSMPIVGNFDPPMSHPAALGATAPIPGDYDGNGMVDLVDFNVWTSTFNSKTKLAADGNHNGVIDNGDFSIWSDNLGRSAYAHAAAAQAVTTAGDFNGSGGVDSADLAVLNSSFNSTSNLAADANGNGVVDAADYTRWQDNLGAGSAGAGGGGGAVAAAATTQTSLLAAIPATSPVSANGGSSSVVIAATNVTSPTDTGALLLLAARTDSSDVALAQFGDGRTNLAKDTSTDDTASAGGASALAVAWQSWDQL